jgi:hypothetical protein
MAGHHQFPNSDVLSLRGLPEIPAELKRLAADFHAGWFQGDRRRLGETLHPGLARYLHEHLPAPPGTGSGSDPSLDLLDFHGNLACLRLRGGWGKVLLQAVRHGERWRVINVLGDAAWVA